MIGMENKLLPDPVAAASGTASDLRRWKGLKFRLAREPSRRSDTLRLATASWFILFDERCKHGRLRVDEEERTGQNAHAM